ncbi:hypothetical protein D9M69_697710 [compost metagenome]
MSNFVKTFQPYYANSTRNSLSYHRRYLVGEFLHAFQESEGLGLGKLLDRGRSFFLADCAAAGRLAHGT